MTRTRRGSRRGALRAVARSPIFFPFRCYYVRCTLLFAIILRTPHADKVAHGKVLWGRGGGKLTPISIWDIPEQGTRGPKGKYDRAAVTVAAIRLADAGGLDAVTMRGVAAELGIAPMSLYNYVPTKDHLIQLMVDMAASEYRYPAPGTR